MTATSPKHKNRLIGETSPYLLQHAHNPVDWYPWGEEALARAKKEDKPIFLSIGYSACHWCHVMERESFENEATAAILNEHFISIKVDREERPDLDDLYMQAVQMITGSGGWPMSVFLTPDLKPFFGGTYFPPSDRGGMMGFPRLLMTLAELYRTERDKIADNAKQITDALHEQETMIGLGEGTKADFSILEKATRELERRYDSTYGGFGGAPKFPPSMALNLLLREWKRTGNAPFLEMVERTLEKMALGGMYDQLGGGFSRYSTDRVWLVPHFEKMLYDNALLAPVYFDAARATGKSFYDEVGRGILDYVLRDMTDPAGGYYSAEDADSEGVEGKFYVWSLEEIRKELGAEADLFCDYYGVTEHGNFEEQNILNVAAPMEEFAKRRGMKPEELKSKLAASSEKLFAIREKRIHPFKDTKVLTAWNGMMISAMARGAQATGDERYRASAIKAGQFILDSMRDKEGGLYRTWGKGKAKIPGFLEDYAYVVTAFMDLYETTFDPVWLEESDKLAGKMITLFYDPAAGSFFAHDGRDPSVLIRRKDVYDGATPSGNSTATFALLRLAMFLDRADYRDAAMKTIASMETYFNRMSGGVHQMINAVGFALGRPKEIAIVGDPAAPETVALLKSLHALYLPGRIIVCAKPDSLDKGFNPKIALLKDKKPTADKPLTIYVCENYACKKPVHDAAAMLELIRR